MKQKDYEDFINFINKLQYEIMDISDYEIILNAIGIPITNKSRDDYWLCKTGCHNVDCGSAKSNLTFYLETRSFYCWSECMKSYSIVSLTKQRLELLGEKTTTYKAVKYICNRLGISFDFKSKDVERDNTHIYNWKASVNKYLKNYNIEFDDKVYNKSVLNYFEPIYRQEWIDDNISVEVMEQYGIKYYPYHNSVVIPCLNSHGELIGIRERFMSPHSDIKYLPLSLINGDSFEFSVNRQLYGLNYNAENIKHYKKVVIGEAEKFTLQCATYFGCKNYSVSLFGKSMSNIKLKKILDLGVNEVIIALDFDYNEVDDNDFEKFKKNVYRIGNYFKPYCKVTALVSYNGHKKNDSPTDNGKEWYAELFKNREELW